MAYIPFVITFGIIAAIILWLLGRMRKEISFPPVLPQEGFAVPIFNAARGTWFFNVHNGLYPSLKFFEDHVEVVVLGKTSFKYSEIREAGTKTGFLVYGSCLIIRLNNIKYSYYLNLNRHNLLEVVRFLRDKGCMINENIKF